MEKPLPLEMETSASNTRLHVISCFHLLQLWPLLLLASAAPSCSAWSLRTRDTLAAARPLCSHRNPSALRSVCLWDKNFAPEKGSFSLLPRQRALVSRGAGLRSAARLRRQAQGSRPATPSGFEDGLSSSQYPWAIVWGPTISVEDGGDANSANPGFPPLDYTFVSSSGMATAQPNSHSLLHNEGLNLRQTPATLRPFLFGPRGEGVDPQLYVTITISVIIVLVAMGIILKFCWDRNQKRRHHSSQQSGLQQQGSQQPLTDLSPTTVSILGPYSDSQAPTPETVETAQDPTGEPVTSWEAARSGCFVVRPNAEVSKESQKTGSLPLSPFVL
ncbi:PILR alpha-associated neural protein isoform X1 [Anolis carolinensis]|uniref:PILR alpha-associated neural protein isoform X1 n=1 Tax=Anolis carolinensis TaxID=28377 RepID=UPI0004627199|nr:PREDICTED: PILR alpha-associated neural protein isoform X1 [Anolis carolinensis]XP_008117502.1 PREDICTED: PILR alpha-associated neural protein isoform X1 [Anolis carolinensis]XP_008117503.1 PREDICTED: PILR alpha-associated neural protein isoform X1 [Anolis carolinensis]XP_008117504.1 PREDICTED: PILR alpha-associated neural protein isoform X1 [Anolis carolinensis]|eukprot:XP_008117501.1 PREDICTED: PILR alpha-associated neural protein isoform X1 [Anolis carolinensis]